jgi:hypothetical protein
VAEVEQFLTHLAVAGVLSGKRHISERHGYKTPLEIYHAS